jgi:hypothetical protein
MSIKHDDNIIFLKKYEEKGIIKAIEETDIFELKDENLFELLFDIKKEIRKIKNRIEKTENEKLKNEYKEKGIEYIIGNYDLNKYLFKEEEIKVLEKINNIEKNIITYVSNEINGASINFDKNKYQKLYKEFQLLNGSNQKEIKIEEIKEVMDYENFDFKDNEAKKEYLIAYEMLIHKAKEFNRNGFNNDVIEYFFKLTEIIEKKTFKTQVISQIEKILNKNFENFEDRIELIQEIERLLHKQNDIENSINLKKQVKEVREKYKKYEEKIEVNRSNIPLWIINLNYNDLKEQGEISINEFEKVMISIIKKHSYAFATSQGFGKKTLLFDNERSFRLFNEFLHSDHFISEVNHALGNRVISVTNRNFHIKVAKVNKKDTIEEIVTKMNDSYLNVNEDEFNYKNQIKLIRKELGIAYKKKPEKKEVSYVSKILNEAKKIFSKKAYEKAKKEKRKEK